MITARDCCRLDSVFSDVTSGRVRRPIGRAVLRAERRADDDVERGGRRMRTAGRPPRFGDDRRPSAHPGGDTGVAGGGGGRVDRGAGGDPRHPRLALDLRYANYSGVVTAAYIKVKTKGTHLWGTHRLKVLKRYRLQL